MTCGLPVPLANAAYTLTSVTYRGSATYRCLSGYRSSGGMTVYCSDDGKWTNVLGKCTVVECPVLTLSTGLLISTLLRTYGTTIYVNCMAGYYLSGRTVFSGISYVKVHCLADGTWDDPLPACKSVHCSPLRQVTWAQQTSTDTVYNTVTQYTCARGFQLYGSSLLRCLSTGKWSASTPVCHPVTCSMAALTYPKHSLLTSSNASYLGLAVFSCKAGFSAEARLVKICQSDRQWSSLKHDCKGM